jgi:hypothetical protein
MGTRFETELWECTFYDVTYGCLLLDAIALLLRHACLSVRPYILPYTWNNSAPTEQIFMKFYNEGVLQKSIVKIQVVYNRTKIKRTLLEDLHKSKTKH